MFDLGKQKIEINCPSCNRRHAATFNDVGKKTIRCGCGTNIQLQDSNNSVRNSVNDINKSFKKLEDAFKKFGR